MIYADKLPSSPGFAGRKTVMFHVPGFYSVCVYIYIYTIHTYIYICIRIYMHTYVCTHVCLHACMCMCAYTRMYMCTYARPCPCLVSRVLLLLLGQLINAEGRIAASQDSDSRAEVGRAERSVRGSSRTGICMYVYRCAHTPIYIHRESTYRYICMSRTPQTLTVFCVRLEIATTLKFATEI